MYLAYISLSLYDSLKTIILCFSSFPLSGVTGGLSQPMKALPCADLMRAGLTTLGLLPQKHLLLSKQWQVTRQLCRYVGLASSVFFAKTLTK